MKSLLLAIFIITFSWNAQASNCFTDVFVFQEKIEQFNEAKELLRNPDEILPRILSDESRGVRSLAGQAMAHLERETNLLENTQRALVWSKMARTITKKYPEWLSSGPIIAKDNSLVFVGSKGAVLVLRSDNNQAYIFGKSSDVMEWGILRDYEYMLPLRKWLESRK
jgi:hypothetical protein